MAVGAVRASGAARVADVVVGEAEAAVTRKGPGAETAAARGTGHGRTETKPVAEIMTASEDMTRKWPG